MLSFVSLKEMEYNFLYYLIVHAKLQTVTSHNCDANTTECELVCRVEVSLTSHHVQGISPPLISVNERKRERERETERERERPREEVKDSSKVI